MRDAQAQHLLEGLENCTLASGTFGHEAHVRTAWWCLNADGPDGAARFVRALRGFVRHHRVEGKYHHTLTLAFLRLIASHLRSGEDWSAFCLRARPLLDEPKAVIGRHYSAARLASDAARTSFVPPDLEPLPPAEIALHETTA